MIKTYQYRIYPTIEQEQALEQVLLVMVQEREVQRLVGYLPAGDLQQKLDIQLDSASFPVSK